MHRPWLGNICDEIPTTDVIGITAAPQSAPCIGGRAFADPDMDARSGVPSWIHSVASTVWIQRTGQRHAHAAPFDPWQLPGAKLLHADGAQLSLITRWGPHSARLVINGELCEGDSFAYVLPAGPGLDARLHDLERHLAALKTAKAVSNPAHARPSRGALVHMRTLQALDAMLAGATHREIASAVFGSQQVTTRWHPDSELRAQVRHLVRRGRQLMHGGYRKLLVGAEGKAGRHA